VADRQLSDKLFDADQDAWFHTAEQQGDRYFFLSFKGQLTEVDLSGPGGALKTATSALVGAGRPSRLAPGRLPGLCGAPRRRWAVVAMHDQGREGSHKARPSSCG
jgi:methylamine dehydrogenase heavy chain